MGHRFAGPLADAAFPSRGQAGVVGVNANDAAGFGLGGLHTGEGKVFGAGVNLEWGNGIGKEGKDFGSMYLAQMADFRG
jgi:hypothetical protein